MAVVLHIGLPKTGSSYLQEWLNLNRRILASSGVHVVSATAARRLGVEVLADAAEAERGDVRQIRDAHALRDAIADIQTAAPHTVVASEYLSLSCPGRMAEILTAANIAVSGVVCYLRRQDHICSSGYAQSIKTLGCSERIGKALYTDRLDWNLLYETWQAAFPQATMHVHNYDKCRADKSLLRTFKNALGVRRLATQDPAEYVNLSLSAEMTEIARMLNERHKRFDPEYLLSIQSKRPFTPYGFSKKTTAEFEELFIGSNRKLAARFPNEFSNFALPGWCSKGEDMTDRISAECMADILIEYVHQRSAAA